MTGHHSHSRAITLAKPRTFASLLAIGLACSLQALSAPPTQQATAQATTQQDKSQPQKPQPDKAQADKVKQDGAAAKPAVPSSSRSVYSVTNGTSTYYRTVETDRKPTKDGEVDTQRVRTPSWNGDNRVLLEKEVHTKNLPDGTVEKEYVTKNTDGANREVPIEIVRERIKKSGEKTTIERETLTPDGEGHWNTVAKEQVNETGPDAARKTVNEVKRTDGAGHWQVVDRQVTTTKSTKDSKESHTVRQLPDAYGRMSDYEVKDEQTATQGGKETHQVTVRRRQFGDTDHPKFYVVDKTTQVKTTSPDGKQVTTHTTTESNPLPDSERDARSYHPRVVEETTEVDTKGPNGEKKVVDVKDRNADDPNGIRPASRVVTETDKAGNVRQVYIPSSSDH